MYTAELKTLRTPEEIQATQARCRANLELMSRIYRKPTVVSTPDNSATSRFKVAALKKPEAPVLVHGPIHQAIIAGDLASVLAHLSPDTVNQATLGGLSPLHLAVFGYSTISETTPWIQARANGRKLPREAIVDALIEAGAKVDAWDHNQRLPSACCAGKRLPDSLVAAIARRIEETAHGVGMSKRQNAFYDNRDLAKDEQTGVHDDSVRK